MADFFNVTSNVSQFGPDDCDINRYKQAGEYALESKQWACLSKQYHDDTITDVTNLLNNAGNDSTILELMQPTGASKVGSSNGKTVQEIFDYSTVDIYVDSLGKFSNGQDGCSEAIMAEVEKLTGMKDSAYVFGQSKFISVIFGYGTYKLKDMVIFSGMFFKGKPGYGTQIIPHGKGSWAFTTKGTLPFDLNGVRVWQRLMYFGFEDLIIGEYWEDRGLVPAGVGGINLQFASYGYFRNVHFRRIKACGLNGSELFDTKFDNVSIMYCGDGTNPAQIIPCLNLDKSGSDDATNALELDRLHLEANYTGMKLRICRHLNFIAPKFERDDTPHLLEGCQGITFTSPNMTWNREDSAQFRIYGVSGLETSDSHGVQFVSPDMRSSNKIGWYFEANSNAGPVELIGLKARGISKLIEGRNYKILGGDCYDSGSSFIIANQDVSISNLTCRTLKPYVAGVNPGDTVIIKGANCTVKDSYFSSQAGSDTDGGSFIDTMATTDSVITGNTFGGYRQYGIKGRLSQKIRDNKIDINNNHIGSLTNQTRVNVSLVNKNEAGLGVGSIDSGVYTIAAGATVSPTNVVGCSMFLVRVIINNAASSGVFLVDSSNAGITSFGINNPALLSFTAGTAGDGMVHITKPQSGLSITVTNNSSNSATVVLMNINGHG